MLANKITKIKTDFGNDAYVGISGDRYFDDISINLRKLWYSPEHMSLANISIYYKRIPDLCYPDYKNEEFEKDMNELNDALAHEFALIIQSKSKQKGGE